MIGAVTPQDDAAVPGKSRIPPQVILLGIVSLLNDVSSDIIYPLLPIFMTTYIGATPLVIGLIEGAAEAVSSFLKLGAGILADRLPRRKPLIVAGYAVAAAARAVVALAGRWPAVLAGRLFHKAGKGIRSAPRDALIAEVTDERSRGRSFGLHRALDHAGAVLGPVIAAVLLGLFHLPLRTIFLVAVIPAAIGVVLLVVALREPQRTSHHAAAPATPGGPLPRPLWKAIAAIALFYMANSSDAFLILQAHAAGVRPEWIALIWAANHAVKSVLVTHAGAFSDRAGRTVVLATGWTLYGVIYLIFPFARSLPAFLALFLVYAVPFALTEGAEKAWVADLVPASLRGKSFGIYHLAVGLCTLAGTALFGVLYQNVSVILAFHAGAGFAFLAAMVAVASGQQKARREG
jgi:MFS family permease